ncbi:MAG: twin-arginine translocase subunit TatC, partial [Peptococcaceae bacterium]|nr:twin-arginine translocase subunit TatC [Peptococcaceae bacterium]
MNEMTAPMLEHLDELRSRLVKSILALLAGMVIAIALFQDELTEILTGPFLALNQSLVFTGLPEGFMFQLKIALLGGCVLASPVIIYQIMRFILPALYSHEKKIFYIMSFSGVLLFVGGICFGYFLVL